MSDTLAGTVHVPAFGTVKKKTAVYGGIGAVVFVVAIYWYRQHQASKATGAATSPAPIGTTDPYPPDGTVGDTTDPNSTDPATGMTYGDEAAGYTAGVGTGQFFPGGSNTDTTGTTTTTGGPPFNTNAAWAQFVEQAMGSTGSDAIAAAIGHYLAGAELTDAEVTTAQEATAIGGVPPVPGPGNFPPSFRTKNPPGHQQNAHNPVKGLKVDARTTQADVSWDAEPNATHYLVKIIGGGKVEQSVTVTGTKTTIHNLKRAHHYTAQVRAQPGGAGGTDARANFTTK